MSRKPCIARPGWVAVGAPLNEVLEAPRALQFDSIGRLFPEWSNDEERPAATNFPSRFVSILCRTV